VSRRRDRSTRSLVSPTGSHPLKRAGLNPKRADELVVGPHGFLGKRRLARAHHFALRSGVHIDDVLGSIRLGSAGGELPKDIGYRRHGLFHGIGDLGCGVRVGGVRGRVCGVKGKILIAHRSGGIVGDPGRQIGRVLDLLESAPKKFRMIRRHSDDVQPDEGDGNGTWLGGFVDHDSAGWIILQHRHSRFFRVEARRRGPAGNDFPRGFEYRRPDRPGERRRRLGVTGSAVLLEEIEVGVVHVGRIPDDLAILIDQHAGGAG
jgi:hypothetical protein